MARLLDNVENSVWHAFDQLALEGDGTAPKSKLKVLVAQIGNVLGLKDVDSGLDDFRSTASLSYDQFRFYLSKEVFSALPDELSPFDEHRHESSLDEVCWALCSTNYLERDNPVFPDECVFKLFRVFCMLGDMVENEDTGKIEVIMAAGEVENACYQFMMSLGRAAEWDPEEFDSVASVIPAFKLGIFITVLESKYARDVDDGGLREAVRDVHDFYLLDVIKKGHLGKKMDLFPAYREHFFVLQPDRLTLYNGSSQKEKRGEIPLDGQCRVEAVPDSNSRSPLKTPGSKSHSRFQVIGNEKTYDFQAQDHRIRSQWIKAFRTAFDHSADMLQSKTLSKKMSTSKMSNNKNNTNGVEHEDEDDFFDGRQRYQRQLLEKRRAARQEEKEREDEERLALGDQLETERQARAFAEEKAETLARQRALEGERMKELEKIREQLETLLQEERQAKKDEEIVRTLQARILNEEWARRETLERLQEEQKAMLEAERKKREEFERTQAEKETQLREAQTRVEEMERERLKLDRQLNLAQEKTRKANIGQEVLEAKMRVKEQEGAMAMEQQGSLSRLGSLNPSASFYVRAHHRTSEGGGRMPMRSASMRETSYSRSIRRRRQHQQHQQQASGDTLSVSNADGANNPNLASNRSSVVNLAIAEGVENNNSNGKVVVQGAA